MTSYTGKQRITVHILPNISRSKGNKTVKYGQLMEYNMKNILLEKSCTKYGGETSLRSLFKKSKLNIPLDQQSETLHSLFWLYVQVEIYQNMIKLRCWPLHLTLCKAILKTKRGLELVSLPNFLHDLKKIFLTLYSILLTDQISLPDCLYFLRHWAVCVL